MEIYLDNAATTPVCPEAAKAAVEAMTGGYGNPSSRHTRGQAALERLRADRADIAAAVGCLPEELVFTSCGSEGDNWAVRAAAELGRRKGRHIITTAVEHAAVLEPVRELEQQGWEVTYLRPDRNGHVDLERLEAALRPDTVLVSMMLVNNELGSILPVKEAVRLIRRSGSEALVHTDAVQAFCKVPFTPGELGVDFLTVSGHKVLAPKGVGALYIRKGIKVKPMIRGGGQEGGLRSGTEATAQIAAFAAACRLWSKKGEAYTKRITEAKNHFLESFSALPGGVVLSPGDAPHICAVSLPGYPGEMLVRELSDRGIYVSSGSACHRGRPSHVFAATGRPKQELMGALRVSFGPGNTKEEGDLLVKALSEIRDSRIGRNF